MAHHFAHRVGPALVLEPVAGIRTGAVDAGGAQAAVIVEVAAIRTLLAALLVRDADLAKRAVGVAAAARETNAVARWGN